MNTLFRAYSRQKGHVKSHVDEIGSNRVRPWKPCPWRCPRRGAPRSGRGLSGGTQRRDPLAARYTGACPSPDARRGTARQRRSEEHTSALQSLMRISYAVFCLKKKTEITTTMY